MSLERDGFVPELRIVIWMVKSSPRNACFYKQTVGYAKAELLLWVSDHGKGLSPWDRLKRVEVFDD